MEEIKEPVPCVAPPEKTKAYVGTKIIRAEPMTHKNFLEQQGRHAEAQETIFGEGYKVHYSDMYQSWSPKDVFEQCYRQIADEEKRLINSHI